MSESSPHIQRLPVGDVLTPDELHQYPFFSSIPKSLLQKNVGAAVLRRFIKGETICVEGQEGSTAFYIVSGKVDILINAAISAVKTQPEPQKSWFKRMTSKLTGKRRIQSGSASYRYIPIDASVDLS